MSYGWICPACGETNAPFALTCAGGPHRKQVVASTTNTPDGENPPELRKKLEEAGMNPDCACMIAPPRPCPVHGVDRGRS